LKQPKWSRERNPNVRKFRATLADLRAYVAADPDFERAIDAVVKAEVAFGHDDPVEGALVDERSARDRLASILNG
jgi:hypothetical protein